MCYISSVEHVKGRVRHRTLLATSVTSFGGFLALAAGAPQHHWLGMDESARHAVGLARMPELDAPFQAVSVLGSPSGLVPLILLASFVLWRFRRRWALALPLVMVGTGALQFLSKWVIDRPRPNLAAWGFPSGHVLSLVVFFGVVGYLVSGSPLSRTWRWLGCGIGAGALLTVAFSRLYLDVHWLTDVLGGFALGLAYLLAVLWLAELSRTRKV